MKCMECKLLKFDGKIFRCPAHPWVSEINVYTEHRNCGASRWYPKYAEDRASAANEQIVELECALADAKDLVTKLKGYQTMNVSHMCLQVETLIVGWQNKLDELNSEAAQWSAEVARLKKGALPSMDNGEAINGRAEIQNR